MFRKECTVQSAAPEASSGIGMRTVSPCGQAGACAEAVTIVTEYLGQKLPELVEGVKKVMYVKPIETGITRLRDENRRKDAELEKKDAELEKKDAELKNNKVELANRDAEIAKKDARIAELERLLSAQGGYTAEPEGC